MSGGRIFISAGEASGDRLGAGLARALLQRKPDLELIGMGGPQMGQAGVRLLQDAGEISVVGIFEVLSHLPAIRAVMGRLERALGESAPDLVVPIDFPDFNLRLATRARRAGVPVVYFVSPQVWAWRPGRIRRIRDLVRRMLVLFPFETRVYEDAGVPVSFVGHPLAEYDPPATDRQRLCDLAGLDAGRTTVALLPGSRRGEVQRMLPILLDSASILSRSRPDLEYLIPVAPGLSESWMRSLLPAGAREIVLHRGDFPQILGACTTGAVAAGTASLEAAVAGLPMVVVYRMASLTYLIGRSLVRLQDVALPNLVAGRRVVPELIQGECRPDRIARELEGYLDDPARTSRVKEELREVHRRLGEPGVFDRAAEQILRELDELARS